MLRYLTLLVFAGVCLCQSSASGEEPPKIDFDRQIRPILSNHCYRCHGPDAGERKAGFRLDMRDSALGKAESGAVPIVPGKAKDSEVVARIHSSDVDLVMPPPSLNKPLSAEQKSLLARWVDEGANFAQHWAFVAPQRPQTPAVKQVMWPRHAIDHFVLRKLEQAGLAPSPEAQRHELIRRVTLDLTGLPPTPREVADFLNDRDPLAYEKVVDRLLDSPHYGERLAVDWLDAARFADTHGYHLDSGRDMTRWREWVIDAFNRNQPFDQFTVEQLAGDLLPSATLEQKVASGFNRNHMINFEGGAIPDEYHTAYIIDRVNTTSTVWLGLTIGCAQCHDHKYDPISQREFYQLYAFFYNVPEKGLDGNQGNAAPLLKAPTSQQARQQQELQATVADLEKQLSANRPELVAAQAAWEKSILDQKPDWKPLAPSDMRSQHNATFTKSDDQQITVSGTNAAHDRYTIIAEIDERTLTAIRLETGVDSRLNGKGPGRSVNGNVVLTDVRVSTEKDGRQVEQKLARATADFSQQDYAIANAIDGDPKSGWAIHPQVGQPHAALFELAEPLTSDKPIRLTIELCFESQHAQHQLGIFRLAVTSADKPLLTDSLSAPISAALKVPAADRTPAQQSVITSHFREHVYADGPGKKSLADAKKKLAELEKSFASTMVMQEMAAPRTTNILVRGQYDKRGEVVSANVPAVLPPLAKDAPHNRLGLAQWLVDPRHPLTSRVIVNRYWQLMFGTGLVKSVEDLGCQGEQPSHPELLNYLAIEFVAPQRAGHSGKPVAAWDVKQLLRLMVTSSTYRQSSRATPALLAADPENRLLGRGPRYRLQAEFIRDQALAISGLLNQEIGGKSVSPYQPAGLWGELSSRGDSKNWTAQFFEQSHGDDLYRRTMYTFWKRTSPPPQLSTFDAPDREICTVRRLRTNTPLQALILLNDPTYVEAARKLAERMMKEGGGTDASRLAFAFRLATAREPSEKEQSILQRVLNQHREKFTGDRAAAEKLLTTGESPRDKQLDTVELASFAMTASVILNLDETVTK